MQFKEQDIVGYFLSQVFSRGRNYYKSGLVKNLKVRAEFDRISLSSQVHGTECYDVTVTVTKDFIVGSCDCPHFAGGSACKHMAATLLAYLGQYGHLSSSSAQSAQPVRRDGAATNLLNAYLNRETVGTESLPPITLAPQILSVNKGYPSIGFTVGHEKLYVVRNVENFLRDISGHRTVSYGKALSFRHDMERFGPQSQALLRILFNEFPQYKSLRRGYYYTGTPSTLTHNKRGICLEGDGFHQFIHLVEGQEIAVNDWGNSVPVTMGDPPLSVQLTATENGALFAVDKPDDLSFFGNHFQLYAISQKGLYCCSEA